MDHWTFTLTDYNVEALLPQAREALQARTDALSREKFSGLWRFTDRLNGLTRGKTRRWGKAFSLVFLAAGLFLTIPGLMSPKELLVPLVVGLIALVRGVLGLLPGQQPEKQFEKSARKLLANKARITGQIRVSFDQTGMLLPEERVDYGQFETVVETADLMLAVFGKKVALLQKKDLTEGEFTHLRTLLQEAVGRYLTA